MLGGIVLASLFCSGAGLFLIAPQTAYEREFMSKKKKIAIWFFAIIFIISLLAIPIISARL
jgi:small-conductance mechanosensitive channel